MNENIVGDKEGGNGGAVQVSSVKEELRGLRGDGERREGGKRKSHLPSI